MTDSYPLQALSSVAGLAAYCVTQVLIARMARAKGPYFSLMIGFVAGLLVTLGIDVAVSCRAATPIADAAALLLLNFVSYLALAFGYFNFVNLSIASLRIRILEELLE